MNLLLSGAGPDSPTPRRPFDWFFAWLDRRCWEASERRDALGLTRRMTRNPALTVIHASIEALEQERDTAQLGVDR